MNNSELLRSRIKEYIGEPADVSLKDIAAKRVNDLFGTGILSWLVNKAKARIWMGTFRYQTTDPRPWSVRYSLGEVPSFVEKLIEKAEIYNRPDNGNAEMLVDIFNYVLLELQQPCHPNHHFKAEERTV